MSEYGSATSSIVASYRRDDDGKRTFLMVGLSPPTIHSSSQPATLALLDGQVVNQHNKNSISLFPSIYKQFQWTAGILIDH